MLQEGPRPFAIQNSDLAVNKGRFIVTSGQETESCGRACVAALCRLSSGAKDFSIICHHHNIWLVVWNMFYFSIYWE